VSLDPRRSALVLHDDPNDWRDKVDWKWSAGEGTTADEFGDPASSDDYALCVFDRDANALLRATAPGSCSSASCWRGLGSPPGSRGFAYRSGSPSAPDGIARVKLGPGAEGRARISVKGKGANLVMPSPLGLDVPVTVQLQAENGRCWETTHTSPSQNDTSVFRARGGS
jgi:hypothetical protein